MLKQMHYYYAKHLESKKLYSLAVPHYKKAYKESSAIVNYRLAFCYEKQKDYKNAVNFFKKAIVLDPSKAHWYLKLATALISLNKNTEALQYLKMSIATDKSKQYHKKYNMMREKLYFGVPEKNIFIQDIQNIKENIFLYTITGTIAKGYNKEKIILCVESRTNTLESTPPCQLYLSACQYKIDKDGVFTASFLLDLNTLKIDSRVIIYTFDFTLKADKEYRIKLLHGIEEVWHHKNYDFIPYRTKHGNYSLMVVRKASKYIAKDNGLNITFFLFKIHYKGGVSKVTIDLVNALADAGHNITLTTMFLANTPNMYPISKKVNFNYVTISTHYEANSLPKNAYATKESISPFFLHELAKYFSKSNTDILYSPVYSSPLLLSIMSTAPAATLKIVGDHSGTRYEIYNTLLNNQNNLQDKNFNSLIKQTLFFKNINTIDAIHLINPLVKEIMIREINKSFIDIPNIIDFGSNITNHKSFKERKKKIILVGSLLKVKNFDTVIKAFSRLQKVYPSWSIEIYGAGIEEKNLKHLINNLKLSKSVELKGFTSSIQDVYENSMIHLSASHKESFGLTMVESMHCGSITIATKQTIGAKYLIEHEKTGFLAENNSEDGICTVLDRVLSLVEKEDSLLKDIQKNAYTASSNFTANNIVQQWEEKIKALKKERAIVSK